MARLSPTARKAWNRVRSKKRRDAVKRKVWRTVRPDKLGKEWRQAERKIFLKQQPKRLEVTKRVQEMAKKTGANIYSLRSIETLEIRKAGRIILACERKGRYLKSEEQTALSQAQSVAEQLEAKLEREIEQAIQDRSFLQQYSRKSLEGKKLHELAITTITYLQAQERQTKNVARTVRLAFEKHSRIRQSRP
ncbi:hypothetical protein KKE06_06005 [Candidatus Micrarchaeota archaeon]|nr:hypothetical protein [Candidatus Micrarchaeota archaeon]MBU1930010.1 hypothetical protein [Candidatus Micrarchaeota archaeon]